MTTKTRRWPLFFIALPAAVAVWSGWVGLGALCGFGVVHPFPGIFDAVKLNTAITLPVGVEAYGAYAMGAWLTSGTVSAARKFAKRSAIGSLCLGMLGQVAYHVLSAAHAARAPWPIVVLVACLPVVTLGFGAALAHLLRGEPDESEDASDDVSLDAPEPAVAGMKPQRVFAGVGAPPRPAAAGSGPAPAIPTTSHRKRTRHAPGAPTVEAAERLFKREIEAGEIPSVRTIMDRLKVGREKAQGYQRHITEKGRVYREAA